VTGDLARKTDEAAVRQSIRNLILTGRGERPFQPDIGSDIYQMLFENITPEVVNLLETMIEDTIKNFEPRCRLLKVEVYSLIDTNDLEARIVFTVINSDTEIELITPLTRAR
jgi:phage baseplate assembly protein W